VPGQLFVGAVPAPPPETTTSETDVTPAGATHENVPGVVYTAQVWIGVTLLDAALAAPVPTVLVAVTVNVYAVAVVNPDTVIVPEPA
jgi:hypothetical protein